MVLICISLMTFEIEHFRKDFHIGHVNTPVDFTQKASRRVFERGVGWKCVWPKVPPNFQVSHHILKQPCGLFRQQVCHLRKISGLPLRARAKGVNLEPEKPGFKPPLACWDAAGSVFSSV